MIFIAKSNISIIIFKQKNLTQPTYKLHIIYLLFSEPFRDTITSRALYILLELEAPCEKIYFNFTFEDFKSTF